VSFCKYGQLQGENFEFRVDYFVRHIRDIHFKQAFVKRKVWSLCRSQNHSLAINVLNIAQQQTLPESNNRCWSNGERWYSFWLLATIGTIDRFGITSGLQQRVMWWAQLLPLLVDSNFWRNGDSSYLFRFVATFDAMGTVGTSSSL
jgi:hypothetical protein